MKFLVCFCTVILMFSAPLLAQNAVDAKTENFKSIIYLSSSNSTISTETKGKFQSRLVNYLGDLQKKQSTVNSERKFLEYLFYKTHNVFLDRYEQYSDFSDLMLKGNYDCLSGSILYAYLLENLGYEYKIQETLYHVYVTVHTPNAQYLFESTDALHGFISNTKEIEIREQYYVTGPKNESQKQGLGSNEYQFQSKAIAQIGLKEAGALQFYNKAIVDFNNKVFDKAYQKLETALVFYPSARIEEMLNLVTQTLVYFEGGNENKNFSQSSLASNSQEK